MKVLSLALAVSAAFAALTGNIINAQQIPSIGNIISNNSLPFCDGTILTSVIIITAAHCVYDGVSKFTIGNKDLNASIIGSSINIQERNITNIMVHSKYTGGAGSNDIALLQLDTPLLMSEVVQPATLPAAGEIIFGNANLSFVTTQNTLETVQVPVLTQDACNTALDTLMGPALNLYNNESNICTGSIVGSGCIADNGGALMQNGVIVGIGSWSAKPCGTPGAPEVYTSVSKNIDFIKQHVPNLP